MKTNLDFCGNVIMVVNGEEHFLHIEDPQNYDLFKFAEQFFLEINYYLNDNEDGVGYIITEINYDYDNNVGPVIGIESFDPRIILSNKLVSKTSKYKDHKDNKDVLQLYIGDIGGQYFIFGQELVGKLIAKLYVLRGEENGKS